MTLQEMCQELHYSENTFKRSFKRTCDSLRKKGIIITKVGIEPKAYYTITYDESLIDPKKSNKTIHTDLIGQRFGHLTVLQDSGERSHRNVVWTCKCDCGNIKNIPSPRLKTGHAKSCGDSNCPYHHWYEDLTNQRFGKLVALYPTTMKDNSHMYWKCQCDCGNITEVPSNRLKNGNTQSCGCIKTSIGEMQIEQILKENHIIYKTQISFNDLKNKKPLRYDFGIYDEDNSLVRLIEFDGIQHFEPQSYFTHSLEETKENDLIKNQYALEHNIPLVRIPYTQKGKMTLDTILGSEYLINNE
jgi:hypothetical protein